jgi:hypothetical protein
MYSCERLNINIVVTPFWIGKGNRNATVRARKTTWFFAPLHASANREVLRARLKQDQHRRKVSVDQGRATSAVGANTGGVRRLVACS